MSNESVSKSPFNITKLLINSWIIIPVLIYLKVVNDWAVNIPMKDDYEVILDFLNHFKNAAFGEKIQLLFSQCNEHRILSSRLVYVLYYALTGIANFKVFVIIANLQLVIIWALLTYIIKQLEPRYWAMLSLIAGFLIFDLSNYENSIMAMAGMQNFGVIALFMATLYFFSQDKKYYLALGAFFEFMTIFSSGNGMVGAFFVALYCLFCGSKMQKIVSVSTLLVFVPLYFIGYHQPPNHVQPTFDIAKSISFFFSMIGSHFAFGETTNTDNANIVGGFFLLLTLGLLPYSKTMFKDKKLMLLLTVLCFILASMATTALFRANMEGIPYYSSRYLIYSHIFMAVTLIVVVQKFKVKPAGLWVSVAIMTLITLNSYKNNYNYGEVGFERENQRLISRPYYHPDLPKAQKIADESCTLDIYCIQDEK